MTYAVQPPPITTLPVAGTDESFPVTRVYCVGRNYAEHAVEMGHDPNREPPFFFAKPARVARSATRAFTRSRSSGIRRSRR